MLDSDHADEAGTLTPAGDTIEGGYAGIHRSRPDTFVKLISSRLVAPLAWHAIYLFVLCVCACISIHFGSHAITLGAVGFQVGPRITF